MLCRVRGFNLTIDKSSITGKKFITTPKTRGILSNQDSLHYLANNPKNFGIEFNKVCDIEQKAVYETRPKGAIICIYNIGSEVANREYTFKKLMQCVQFYEGRNHIVLFHHVEGFTAMKNYYPTLYTRGQVIQNLTIVSS